MPSTIKGVPSKAVLLWEALMKYTNILKAAKTLSSEAEKAAEASASLELNGLSIEQIVGSWHNNLQTHVELFSDAANTIRARDQVLLTNEKNIIRLAKEAQTLKQTHYELRSQLETISDLHYDLHTSLEQLESHLNTLENEQKISGNFDKNADQERADAYQMANNVNQQLNMVSGQLKEIVEQLNTSYETELEENTPSNMILKILNKHYLSLEAL